MLYFKLETLPDLTQDKQNQRNTRKIQNEKPLLTLPTVTTGYSNIFTDLDVLVTIMLTLFQNYKKINSTSTTLRKLYTYVSVPRIISPS